jgi:hypothetical protein
MASRRFYAYYIRGSQIALVEHDNVSGSGQTLGQPSLDDIGPSGALSWKSPVATVADGLEIEYAYSPRYTLYGTGNEGIDLHQFIGWGSDGRNLLLFTYGTAAVRDISGLFSANDYIVISGSGRWNGLHQVKSTGSATGILTLKTEFNIKPAGFELSANFATAGTLDGSTTAHDLNIENFKDQISIYDGRGTPYIFIENAANAENNGIFAVTYGSTSGQITLGNKITLDAYGDYTSTASDIQTASADTIDMHNIFYEQMSVYESVNVLSDETDTIDLPEYLTKGLVYYVKAKVAEDMMDIEQKEYFMREFRRILEKHESSKIRGPRMMIPGGHGIR